ncbi:MAG: heavy metal translocating P-type ATPase [Deltaproteobacteria bacterium]|nr:heavy metal translocating P-type ATPase [Deltaproteobacteria bacterium]
MLTKENSIALIALLAIVSHLVLKYALDSATLFYNAPLLAALFLGGIPLVFALTKKAFKKQFGSDLLAGISIIASVLLGEYLAGTIVVLMLSGGESLENYAVRSASSVLQALSKRIPNMAHKKTSGSMTDVPLSEIAIGDILVIYPHEVTPVDGIVIEGHGIMDEAYLTGEPFSISKSHGSMVLSGAINGDKALTIRATRLPKDSRYAQIMEVMQHAEENRPRIRRLADTLGAWYAPLALLLAAAAWIGTGDPIRFLAVIVVATPCPLLLAIPIAIIGSISLAAKRGIIIKDPSVLEQMDDCGTIIFDKTGTLTYGIPKLTGEIIAKNFQREEILKLAASLEQYSKHPLSTAILKAASSTGVHLTQAEEISEPPGQGLRGIVDGKNILITSRNRLLKQTPTDEKNLPEILPGLECVIAINGVYAATYRFHDGPRTESKPFVGHLSSKHRFNKIMLVSGDREIEVRYLADLVGIKEIHASQSPEEKVMIVRKETEKAKTLFIGDGFNDAPALMTATVGVALGQNSDITTKAAGAVIMESSLEKVDEFFHISRRMKRIALQSAIGGMALSVLGMALAMAGLLTPVAGAVAQEVIDVLAIANALRAAWSPKTLIDF